MAMLITKVVLLFICTVLPANAVNDLDLEGDSMSGALVGGLPEDDVLDSPNDDDESLDTPLDSATSFHRFATRKHSKQSASDDDDDEKDKDDSDDEENLARARAQKLHAEAELKSFKDDMLFEKSLAADVAAISNETQSPALAEFLGEIKENQRKYARPEYIAFLKKQIKKADKTIKKDDGDSDDGDKKEDDDEDDSDDRIFLLKGKKDEKDDEDDEDDDKKSDDKKGKKGNKEQKEDEDDEDEDKKSDDKKGEKGKKEKKDDEDDEDEDEDKKSDDKKGKKGKKEKKEDEDDEDEGKKEKKRKKGRKGKGKKDDEDDEDDVKKGKKGKKKKKDNDDEETIYPSHQSAGETFAIAFFANVAMLTIVFAMANSQNRTVSNYTWFLLDQVVCIFLAVMHFQAFDSSLDFSALGVGSAVFASIIHTLVLLAVVLAVAYYFTKRGNTIAVSVICGAGAHFVSFSSIHSSASMQNKVFVSASYTVTMCLLGLLVLGLGIAIIAYIIYSTKSRVGAIGSDYMDKSDDVENDAGATAFSVVFTMMIRFMLTGHHPVDDETEFDHTSGQRATMLVYAIICLIVASFGINVIGRFEPQDDKQYAKKRVCNFFKAVLAMNVAWAFLYWGEWEFFEYLYPQDPTKGRVMFAVVSTMIGGCLLLALTRVPDGNGSAKAKVRAKTLALTALGLVIAFSWELTFDSAMEQMVEGTAHPVFLKVLSCIAMLAIILPVYALYMKPIVNSHSIEG